jgi:hypothetical protein
MLKSKTEMSLALLVVVLLLSLLTVVPAPAQVTSKAIADQVKETEHGTVRFSFEARDGVCGDGDSYISVDGSTFHSRHYDDDDWDPDCDDGPVRISLKVRDGEVVSMKTRVGGRWRRAGHSTIDLGDVTPQEAADYLLDVARYGRESAAEDAIFPTTLARDVVVWPTLLKFARSRSIPQDVREQSVFWLGQIAGEKVTEGISRLVDDDDVDLEVRETAIFALSQRRESESTRHLIKIARTSPHPQLRKNALFWLAQKDDPEVLDVFEEILLDD